MHKTSGPFGKQTVNLQNIKLNYHTRSPNCGQKKNTNQLRPMRQKECDWVRHRLSLLIWLDVRSNYFRTCCHQTVLKEFNHGHGSHGRIDMLITAIYSVTCSCQTVSNPTERAIMNHFILSVYPFSREQFPNWILARRNNTMSVINSHKYMQIMIVATASIECAIMTV